MAGDRVAEHVDAGQEHPVSTALRHAWQEAVRGAKEAGIPLAEQDAASAVLTLAANLMMEFDGDPRQNAARFAEALRDAVDQMTGPDGRDLRESEDETVPM